MADAYLIETAGETAGIVVVEKRGVRFFASEPAFYSLDGQTFDNLRAVHRAVASIRNTRTRGAARPALQPAA